MAIQPDAVQDPHRRVTSADVARASGVSRATVSYVLNDTPGRTISPKTRELVLKTAADLGHLPFAPARSLRLGRSEIVLALVRDFGLGFISNDLLHQLDRALAARGYIMLVHRFDPELRSIPELWGQVTPALVVAMGGMAVPGGSMIESNSKLLRVHGGVRHQVAGRMQVSHLADTGHTCLGYAYPASDAVRLVAEERLAGSIAEATERGLRELDVHTVDLYDPSTVRAAVDAWLASGVTAIVAHNDELALTVIAALAERDVQVGRDKDIAIIGADDIPAARISLTTIRIDTEAWGRSVIASVLAMIDGEEPEATPEDLLSLVVRSSA